MVHTNRRGEAMPHEVVPTDEFNLLYEEYGKPLEAEHWGEFIVIMPDGRFFLDSDAVKAAAGGYERFGPGGILYCIGPRVLGTWRTFFSQPDAAR